MRSRAKADNGNNHQEIAAAKGTEMAVSHFQNPGDRMISKTIVSRKLDPLPLCIFQPHVLGALRR